MPTALAPLCGMGNSEEHGLRLVGPRWARAGAVPATQPPEVTLNELALERTGLVSKVSNSGTERRPNSVIRSQIALGKRYKDMI